MHIHRDGAGKSSFLRSYFKRNRLMKSSIWISLLDFCEKSEDEDILSNNANNSEFERRLEVDILQHILFSCYDDVTYSRITRPKTLSLWKAIWLCAFWLSWLVFILSLNWRIEIVNWMREFNVTGNPFAVIIVAFYVSFLVVPVIVWLTEMYGKSAISAKFNFSEGELGLNTAKVELAPVNVALCELIMFFAETKNEIVVFEDIDRSRNRRIFSKLREACIAINRSPIVNSKKNVRFIYCVREDVFSVAEERTKFFDCIIPVLPYLNRSNVNALLVKNLQRGLNGKAIPARLMAAVTSLSRYIPDARTMNNIWTEFFLHRAILRQDEHADYMLFGLMTFKNLLPDEYAKLSDGSGAFGKILKRKNQIINEVQTQSNGELARVQAEYKEWRDAKLKAPKRERRAIKKEETAWLAKIATLQAKVEKEQSVSIGALVHQNRITQHDISRLLNSGHQEWKAELLYALIDIGCLAEASLDFVSLFHEGYLCREDKRFELDVLSGKANPWTLKLRNPNFVAADLQSHYFSHVTILNFSLLTYMIDNRKAYSDKLALWVNAIVELGGVKSLDFVDEYLRSVNSPRLAGRFAYCLIRYWNEYLSLLLGNNGRDLTYKARQVAAVIRAFRLDMADHMPPIVRQFLNLMLDASILWKSKACTKEDVVFAIKEYHLEFCKCMDNSLERSGIRNIVLEARKHSMLRSAQVKRMIDKHLKSVEHGQ